MSQQTALPTRKGLSKTTVTIIVALLLSILSVSLFFNIISYTSNPQPPIDRAREVSLEWTEYNIGTENNLYIVLINLTLQNPDPRYAWVQVLYTMYNSNGQLTLEPSPINTTDGAVWTPPVSYTTTYGLGPNMTIICGFSFLYLKPQNTTTQLRAEIGAEIPIV